MDIRQRLQVASTACEQFVFRRYFIQMISERLGVLESEYHASYEENRNKDYSQVVESLQKMTESLTVLRNRPKYDQYGKNGEFWDSYRLISEQFNEFVLKLQRCGFIYTCGINKGILDLLMVPETGVSKMTFAKLDAMHDVLKESLKKWGLKQELKSEIALLFWYTEVEGQVSKLQQNSDVMSFQQFQQSLDQFAQKLEGQHFDNNSLQKLLMEKSVLNATQTILTKYKKGFVGTEYIETVLNLVYPNPSLKLSIFSKDSNKLDQLSASTFGQESIAISSTEPLLLQVVECPMDLSNVKNNEIIKITPKTITQGNNPEQLLKQPGVVYFGRQTNKNSPIVNDVSFPPSINRVSRQQFQIVSQSMNYYSIICTSPSNPTYLKVADYPYELQRHMIFKLGEYKFLVTDLLNETQQINQTLDLSVNQPLTQLIRLNLNMDVDPPFLTDVRQTFQDIDLLEKSQDTSSLIPQVLCESTLPEDSTKLNEPTIILKNLNLKQNKQSKPFIEITCIQGEFNPGKVMREEVAQENHVQIITFGRDQRNKFYLPEKEVSRFHCQIVYDAQKRWKICEKYIPDQKNLSSGGTFIQLQNFEQSKNEQYSNPCPLLKGMLIYSEGATFKVI